MSTDVQAQRGWSRRKVAWLGLSFVVPFFAIVGLLKLLSAFSLSSVAEGVLIVLMFPFVFVGGAGMIMLLVTWFTPAGKRPFVDPIKLW